MKCMLSCWFKGGKGGFVDKGRKLRFPPAKLFRETGSFIGVGSLACMANGIRFNWPCLRDARSLGEKRGGGWNVVRRLCAPGETLSNAELKE